MIPDSYRTRSPDAWELHAEGGSNVAQATITGERTKGWFTNVLLAVCICALIGAGLMYRYASMVNDLKRYDLDFFIQHDFADLKTQARVDHELIQAYGLQKAVKDAAQENDNGRRRTRDHQASNPRSGE